MIQKLTSQSALGAAAIPFVSKVITALPEPETGFGEYPEVIPVVTTCRIMIELAVIKEFVRVKVVPELSFLNRPVIAFIVAASPVTALIPFEVIKVLETLIVPVTSKSADG